MCPFRSKGDFLYSPGKRLVMVSKSKRKRAKSLPCGKRPWLCRTCGCARHIISLKLEEHLREALFALPAPLPRRKAKRWTPTTREQEEPMLDRAITCPTCGRKILLRWRKSAGSALYSFSCPYCGAGLQAQAT